MKKAVVYLLVFAVCILMLPCSFAVESEETNREVIHVDGKYNAADILAAIENSSKSTNARSSVDQTILNDVLMQVSMDIQTPHIDPSKVLQTVDVYTLDPAFAEALAEHGVYETSMTYSEFEAMENTWLLPPDFVESVKYAYPELADSDMSGWTYGMYKEYAAEKDEERFLASLTAEELAQLDSRGIQVSDMSYLLKEYHTVEAVLAQSNDSLKTTLEAAYNYTYSLVEASTQSTRATPSSAYYTFVYFPRYNYGNGDYFHNSVLTTTYWQNIQADRALRTQGLLYSYSSSTLCCTNMYGTYSYSQEGAHEGIDFVHPAGYSTPTIFAVFRGEKITSSSTYQLSVYDVNSPDEPKTYTYLHMNTVNASSNVEVLDSVGQQGNLGNATGYHVHFEVHAGNTDDLSPGNDDTVESLSPYRLHDYIGELGCSQIHYIWSSNSYYHWRECDDCGYSTSMYAHTFSNGKCTVCGQSQIAQNSINEPVEAE